MGDVDQEYIICQIGWKFVGSLETDEEERNRYTCLAKLLDENQHSTRSLLENDGQVPPDFTLRRRDLTAEGFELLRRAMPRWLKGVDRSKKPENVGILVKELQKMRGQPRAPGGRA